MTGKQVKQLAAEIADDTVVLVVVGDKNNVLISFDIVEGRLSRDGKKVFLFPPSAALRRWTEEIPAEMFPMQN